MRKILATAAVSLLAAWTFTGAAVAADLIIDEPAVEAATAGVAGIYVELYGGATLGGTSTWEGSDNEMDMGAAFGASLGLTTPVPGLSFELDAMKSGGAYTGYNSTLDNYSIMVDAEYALPVADAFELYGSAGIGFVLAVYDSPNYAHESGWGAGYQFAAGARAKVAEGISVFGEIKYQNTFDEISAGNFEIQYPSVNALAGLRFAF